MNVKVLHKTTEFKRCYDKTSEKKKEKWNDIQFVLIIHSSNLSFNISVSAAAEMSSDSDILAKFQVPRKYRGYESSIW